MNPRNPRPEPPVERRPVFGAVYLRRYGLYALYFDSQLQGYIKDYSDAYDWLDERILEQLGPASPWRFQPYRTRQRIKSALGQHSYRAARFGVPGKLEFDDWVALCCHFGGVCLRCGTTGWVIADHVIPMSCGGPNLIVNVQPLCQRCNSHKSNNWTDYRDPGLLKQFLLRFKR